MELKYEYNENYGMKDITFEGLNGHEYVTSTKDALNVMKVKNPAIGFREDTRKGHYNALNDEEFRQALDTMKCVSSLWSYPDEPRGSKPQSEMNILALLANAITLISKQQVEIREYKEFFENRE